MPRNGWPCIRRACQPSPSKGRQSFDHSNVTSAGSPWASPSSTWSAARSSGETKWTPAPQMAGQRWPGSSKARATSKAADACSVGAARARPGSSTSLVPVRRARRPWRSRQREAPASASGPAMTRSVALSRQACGRAPSGPGMEVMQTRIRALPASCRGSTGAAAAACGSSSSSSEGEAPHGFCRPSCRAAAMPALRLCSFRRSAGSPAQASVGPAMAQRKAGSWPSPKLLKSSSTWPRSESATSPSSSVAAGTAQTKTSKGWVTSKPCADIAAWRGSAGAQRPGGTNKSLGAWAERSGPRRRAAASTT
mmetsp:Transcript_80111/g.248659  ORF Transcript_80111/g.248659 Transcript_80111/m.248659 type:complete len:309 (-) Transcript_80111:8-934(-)